jgi:SAM domain (Sterile alpha motif)
MQIAEWLEKLGMSEYTQRFAENDIDVEVLSELTDKDFDRLGVSIGHRRKMMRAIRELAASPVSAEAQRPASATTDTQAAPRDTAERRQVTVMFSDLVGSTALSARMDPEDTPKSIENSSNGSSGGSPNACASSMNKRACSNAALVSGAA